MRLEYLCRGPAISIIRVIIYATEGGGTGAAKRLSLVGG